MSYICHTMHQKFASMKRYRFPFNENDIPKNGIYILFEKGETDHGTERVVRVGTHTGDRRLVSRLKEHFIKENKDRSIFRKNIGRAFLSRKYDAFLEQWNWDLTTRKNKDKLLPLLDIEKQRQIEYEVSQYIQENFSFTVFEVCSKEQRLDLESKIISSISLCNECKPTDDWLGNSSPIDKIRKSGLWLVQGLYKQPLDLEELNSMISV